MIKTVLAALAVAAYTSQAQAVAVVQWDFEAVTAPAASTTWSGIAASLGAGTASGVHASSATWSTPAGNGSAKSASVNTWAVGDYWQFSFSTTGYSGLILSVDQAGSSTGPKDFKLTYSTDGTAYTDFSTYTVLASTWTSASSSSAFTNVVNLSAVSALNNSATVFVRLIDNSTASIGGATVASGGTGRVDNFTVNLTPVPEADTAAMLLAGLAALAFIAKRRNA